MLILNHNKSEGSVRTSVKSTQSLAKSSRNSSVKTSSVKSSKASLNFSEGGVYSSIKTSLNLDDHGSQGQEAGTKGGSKLSPLMKGEMTPEIEKAIKYAEKNKCFSREDMEKTILPTNNYTFFCIDASKIPLEDVKELGKGAFGRVVLSKLPDGTEHAVKESYFTHAKAQLMLKEINFMACFRDLDPEVLKDPKKSKNYVAPMEACVYERETDDITKIKIIMPKMDRTLQELIFESSIKTRDANSGRVNKPFTATEITYKINLMNALALGIRQLHNKGLIHRDLKTENILMHGERPYIGDLGLAEYDSEAKNKGYAGTPMYMAPELQNKFFCKKSDIYSLGLMFYAIIIDRDPNAFVMFRGNDGKAKDIAFIPLPSALSGFKKLIEQMLADDHEKRPSATEVANFFTGYVHKKKFKFKSGGKGAYVLHKLKPAEIQKLKAAEDVMFKDYMAKKAKKAAPSADQKRVI